MIRHADILSAFEKRLRADQLQHNTQINPAVEQNENVKWSKHFPVAY